MSAKQIVEQFLDASTGDVADARHLLVDELVWELNGEVQTTSADDFVARQRADLESGSAETEVEALISEGEDVVVIGWASFTPNGEGQKTMRLRMAEYFQFSGGQIASIKDVFAGA